MHRLAQTALLAPISTGAIAASHTANTRSLSLDEVLGKPGLIGHKVDVTACSGVPITDDPTVREYALLYRCDEADPDKVNNTNAAFGHFTKSTTVKAAPTPGNPSTIRRSSRDASAERCAKEHPKKTCGAYWSSN